MRERIQNVSTDTIEPLSRWELCATAPGALSDATALAAAPLAWTPALVPSTVASVLRSSGGWSLDATSSRRFDAEDFWYRTSFRCAPAADDEAIVLAFDGLATVADVYLNGALLFSSEDMFVAYEHRIDGLLAAGGDNELAIRFRSLDALLAARRPRPRWRAPMIEHQQLRWFRTTLLGRTPGWSPPAAPVGPWRAIRLERRRELDISDVRLRPTVQGDAGILDVSCDVRALGSGGAAAAHSVEIELESRRDGATARAPLALAGDRWSGRIEIPDVDLWWPHTHGDRQSAPALYSARLRVRGSRVTEVAVELGAIGFRTIDIDRTGDGFALRVNGVRVFCRGACWTPLDPISLQAPVEAIDAAIAQVRDAGMNMLRLSGAMVYEDDAFFDACDRAGILVWQDFMFANMDYPEGDASFDAHVTLETRQLLARLQARPCVAVLCGNSELEQQAAMWGATRELWSPALFHRTLAALARELCPDVPYWPSSTHGGAFPHQPTVGTTSYYGVGAYLRPLDDARRSEVRFASECLAFANVPEPSGVAAMPGGASSRIHHPSWKSRTPRDLGAGWDFDDVRDHYLRALFHVDPLQLRYGDHDRYLALSRVVSGEVMARTFAEWRRRRSITAGGLVWFLRDLWPGAGWGVIDAAGTPKAPYWFLRRAMQPLAVAITDEGQSGLFVHVTNDERVRIEAKIELALFRHGEVRVGGGSIDLDVAPHDAIELAAGDFFEGFVDTSYAYRFGPPSHDLVVVVLRNRATNEVLAETAWLPLGLARAREADLGLTAEATARANGDVFDLAIRTRRFAQSVAIEVDGFAASDNYFHVVPNSERRVVLMRRGATGPLRGNLVALNAESPARISVAT